MGIVGDVASSTPVDLATLLDLDKPTVRASYDYADTGEPHLTGFVDAFLAQSGLR